MRIKSYDERTGDAILQTSYGEVKMSIADCMNALNGEYFKNQLRPIIRAYQFSNNIRVTEAGK